MPPFLYSLQLIRLCKRDTLLLFYGLPINELLILYLLKNTFRKLLFFLDQAVSFSIIQYNVFSVNTQSIFMDNKTFIILFIQDFSYYNSALYFIEINGNYFF